MHLRTAIVGACLAALALTACSSPMSAPGLKDKLQKIAEVSGGDIVSFTADYSDESVTAEVFVNGQSHNYKTTKDKTLEIPAYQRDWGFPRPIAAWDLEAITKVYPQACESSLDKKRISATALPMNGIYVHVSCGLETVADRLNDRDLHPITEWWSAESLNTLFEEATIALGSQSTTNFRLDTNGGSPTALFDTSDGIGVEGKPCDGYLIRDLSPDGTAYLQGSCHGSTPEPSKIDLPLDLTQDQATKISAAFQKAAEAAGRDLTTVYSLSVNSDSIHGAPDFAGLQVAAHWFDSEHPENKLTVHVDLDGNVLAKN